MTIIENQTYQGERPLFGIKNKELININVLEGESGLKKVENLHIIKSTFEGKYPLWHAHNIIVKDSILKEGARAAIWYSNEISLLHTTVKAPKIFRDSSNIRVYNSTLNAPDSFWDVTNIDIKDTRLTGQYQFLHSKEVTVNNLILDGNYSFQHTKNVVIKNSKLKGKDLFWNSETITVYDSEIDGEYLGWYSKDITFINCTIKGTQPLCYMENIVLKNCKMIDTDLSFEESTVNADIVSNIKSVKNPLGGIIKAHSIDKYIDDYESKTIIEVRKGTDKNEI